MVSVIQNSVLQKIDWSSEFHTRVSKQQPTIQIFYAPNVVNFLYLSFRLLTPHLVTARQTALFWTCWQNHTTIYRLLIWTYYFYFFVFQNSCEIFSRGLGEIQSELLHRRRTRRPDSVPPVQDGPVGARGAHRYLRVYLCGGGHCKWTNALLQLRNPNVLKSALCPRIGVFAFFASTWSRTWALFCQEIHCQCTCNVHLIVVFPLKVHVIELLSHTCDLLSH